MTPDWKALAPHRPLGPESDAYVSPPDPVGERIAHWILAGGETVLLGGPTGVGKSTELARAVSLLKDERLAVWVPVDRWENMRKLTGERLLWWIAGRTVATAIDEHGVDFDPRLTTLLHNSGFLTSDHHRTHSSGLDAPAADVAQLALRQASRESSLGAVVVVDGLEKISDTAQAASIFEALAELPEDVAIISVLPWSLAFGPMSEVVIRANEKPFWARPSRPRTGDVASHDFLRKILHERLDGVADSAPESFEPAVVQAVLASGGLPRAFLQLISDAATYARLVGKDWPTTVELASAKADIVQSMQRLLLKGDKDLLAQARNTDGTEIPLAHKIRLMANGLLLQREALDGEERKVLVLGPAARRMHKLRRMKKGELFVEPHPLIGELIASHA